MPLERKLIARQSLLTKIFVVLSLSKWNPNLKSMLLHSPQLTWFSLNSDLSFDSFFNHKAYLWSPKINFSVLTPISKDTLLASTPYECYSKNYWSTTNFLWVHFENGPKIKKFDFWYLMFLYKILVRLDAL